MTGGPRVLAVSGSPSAVSRTGLLVRLLADRLAGQHGMCVDVLHARDLPAAALLHADTSDPDIAAAVAAVTRADGVVLATPIYQAAYSGLLKALLDVLPKRAFAGKVVLPVATAGSAAHLLAMDYALRPILSVLGATLVLPGHVVLNSLLAEAPDGRIAIDPAIRLAVDAAVDTFAAMLRSAAAILPPTLDTPLATELPAA
jgi:FMN reductase